MAITDGRSVVTPYRPRRRACWTWAAARGGRRCCSGTEAQAEATAIDPYEPFLAQPRQEAEHRGLGDRVHAVALDFAALPYPTDSLLERMAVLDPELPGMAEAMRIQRPEIELRRSYGTEYGYTCYVLRPRTANRTESRTAS